MLKINWSWKGEKINNWVRGLSPYPAMYTVYKKKSNTSTLIGPRGSNFSIGQLQRLNIARALYSKPKILIMDEPTASLDSKTESKILDTIIKLKNIDIKIIVTHNKKVLRKWDLILP